MYRPASRPLLSQVTHHYVLCCGQAGSVVDRIGFEMDVDRIESNPRRRRRPAAGQALL
jgi:hypothetical protein